MAVLAAPDRWARSAADRLERFLTDSAENGPRTAYVRLGVSRRLCIGGSYAVEHIPPNSRRP